MKRRINLIRKIYKKAAYEGFPFLHWFENDTAGEYDKEKGRLYIPYSEERSDFGKAAFDHEWTKFSHSNPDIFKMITVVRPDVIKYKEGTVLYLDQGFIYKDINGEKNILAEFNYRFFSKYLRKVLMESEFFKNSSDEDFAQGKNNFINDICDHKIMLSDNFSNDLLKLIKDKYTKSKENENVIFSEIMSIIRQDRSSVVEFLKGVLKPNLNTFGKYYVVFSHNKKDVEGMFSRKRRWNSCLTGDKNLFCETEGGGFAAYFIHADDLDIKNPLSRIFIRRLDTEDGSKSIAMPEISIHGIQNSKFYDIVKNWINSKQPNLNFSDEVYNLKGMDYSDTFALGKGTLEELYGDSGPDREITLDVTEVKKVEILDYSVHNELQSMLENVEKNIEKIDLDSSNGIKSVNSILSQAEFVYVSTYDFIYVNNDINKIKLIRPDLFKDILSSYSFEQLNKKYYEYIIKYFSLCDNAFNFIKDSILNKDKYKNEILEIMQKESEKMNKSFHENDLSDDPPGFSYLSGIMPEHKSQFKMEQSDRESYVNKIIENNKDVGDKELFRNRTLRSLKDHDFGYSIRNLCKIVSDTISNILEGDYVKNFSFFNKINRSQFSKIFELIEEVRRYATSYLKDGVFYSPYHDVINYSKIEKQDEKEYENIKLQLYKKLYPSKFISKINRIRYGYFEIKEKEFFEESRYLNGKIQKSNIPNLIGVSLEYNRLEVQLEKFYGQGNLKSEIDELYELDYTEYFDDDIKKSLYNAINNILEFKELSLEELKEYIQRCTKEINFIEKSVKPHKRIINKIPSMVKEDPSIKPYMEGEVIKKRIQEEKYKIEQNIKENYKDKKQQESRYFWIEDSVEEHHKSIDRLKDNFESAKLRIESEVEEYKKCYEILKKLEAKSERYSSLLNILKKIGL